MSSSALMAGRNAVKALFWLIAGVLPPTVEPQTVDLATKHGANGDILRGSAVLLRLNGTYTPTPEFPTKLLHGAKQGLVVIEIAVSARGIVLDSKILESFDSAASTTVSQTLKDWRFHTEAEMIAAGILDHCRGCIRVNRLAFDFRIEAGRGRVVDLAMEAIERQNWQDPFKLKPAFDRSRSK